MASETSSGFGFGWQHHHHDETTTTTNPPALSFSWAPITFFVVFSLFVASVLAFVFKRKLELDLIEYVGSADPLCVSWVEAITPKHLLLLRVSMFIFSITVLIYSTFRKGFAHFSFFTVWNYTLLTLYFLLSSLLTAVYVWKGREGSEMLPKWLRWLTWALFEMEACMTLLVDVTLWTALYAEADSDERTHIVQFASISMHAVNALFLYGDLAIGCVPIAFWHGIMPLSFVGVYCYFSWIWYKISKKWDYFFMDPSDNVNVAWYSCEGLMVLIFWYVAWRIAHKRDVSYNQYSDDYSAVTKRSMTVNEPLIFEDAHVGVVVDRIRSNSSSEESHKQLQFSGSQIHQSVL